MRKTISILAIPAILVVVSGCARTETPEEARTAAQDIYAEFDRLAAEGGSSEEDVIAGLSPGQINTGSTVRLTPGSWSVATIEGERMARFGEEEGNPTITIACETGGGIDVRLIGMPPQGGSQTVYFSAPQGGSTFTASEAVGDISAAYISVPSADPFIGRLISGSGPFSIRMGGAQTLAFAADDVLTSVVSSCDRRGASSASSEDRTTETPAVVNSTVEAETAGDTE